MYRTSGMYILKKFAGAALIVLCAALCGLLFYRFGGIRYLPDGTNGVMTGADLSFSIVFSLFLLLFYFICGLCAAPGGLAGLTLVSGIIIGGGMAGYLGYAYLLGPAQELYFLFLAPFVPIFELLSQLSFLSANSDLLFIAVPALLALLKLAAYLAGARIRRTPELVERSLRRIDRFYEYRRPLEETHDADMKSA